MYSRGSICSFIHPYMFIGFSAQVADKRVNLALEKLGYKTYEVFYSPIGIWLFFQFWILATFFCCIGILIVVHGYLIPLLSLLFVYSSASYCMAAYLNNSFALTETELIIINPNFPFKRYEKFQLSAITSITIDERKSAWLLALMVLGSNYIDIKTGNSIHRFYCSELEMDAFDENLTEKTIDDFDHSLKKKGIKTQFNVS